MSKFDKPSMRKRFWELREIKDEFDRKVEPFRQEAKELGQQMKPLQEKQTAALMKVKEIQAQMEIGEVNAELAFISRGLAGKVGTRNGS